MKIDAYRDKLIRIGYFLGIGLLFYFFFAYALPLLLPFLLAFLFAVLLKAPADWLAQRLRLPNRLVRTVLVTLFFVLLAVLCLFCGSQLISFARTAVARYNGRIVPALQDITTALSRFFEQMDPQLVSLLQDFSSNLVNTLGEKVAQWSTALVSGAMTGLPSMLLEVLFMVIATYFISLDFGILRRGIQRRMEQKRFDTLSTGFSYFCRTIGKYLRSYSLIFLITFGELAAGLFLVGINHCLLIALLIALFDILPVVGSGMIMLPWALITLIRGNTPTGIGLLAVYLVVVIARQFQEPAIVGEQVGLHPLVTLMAMFIGYRLFGGLGLWGVPITCAMLQSLEKDGIIHIFPTRELPEEPAEKPRRKNILEKFKKSENAAQDVTIRPHSDDTI